MKNLCLALFMLAFPSLLLGKVFVYEGHGTWKKSNGESGEYGVLVHKTIQEDGSVRIIKTVTRKDTEESMTWSMVISKSSDGFVTVNREDGSSLGSGYYFEHGGKMIGHLDMETDGGMRVEKTVCVHDHEYKSIGSHENADGTKTTWSEKGHQIYP